MWILRYQSYAEWLKKELSLNKNASQEETWIKGNQSKFRKKTKKIERNYGEFSVLKGTSLESEELKRVA